MKELIDLITEIVNASNGIKGVNLSTKVIEHICLEDDPRFEEKNYEPVELLKAIDEAVEQGKIFEIEFCVPDSPDRIRSFYLPANTEIKLVNYRDPNWIRSNEQPVRPTHIDRAGGELHGKFGDRACKIDPKLAEKLRRKFEAEESAPFDFQPKLRDNY